MMTHPSVLNGDSGSTSKSRTPDSESSGEDYTILFVFDVFDEKRHADLEDNGSAEARKQIKTACALLKVQLLFFETKSRDQDEWLLLVRAKPGSKTLELHAQNVELEKRLKVGGYEDFSLHEKKRPRFYQQAFFTSLERQRLILSLLEMDPKEGGGGIPIDAMLKEAPRIKALVPLHDPKERDALYQTWIANSFTLSRLIPSLRFWTPLVCVVPKKASPLFDRREHTTVQPLDEVRDYFGEKVALYFAFTESVTRDLAPLAVVGLLMHLSRDPSGSSDHPLVPLYSVGVLAWIAWVQKNWARQCKRLAFHWSSEDFEEEERARLGFQGPMRMGFYTPEGYWVGKDDVLFSPHGFWERRNAPMFRAHERLMRTMASYSVIVLVIGCLAVLTVSMLVFRSFLMAAFYAAYALPESVRGEKGAKMGATLSGVMLSLFVSATNKMYSDMATKLNEWENHRTPTDYEDALIIKNMLFKFINSYAALMYTAFVKAQSISLVPGANEYCHHKETYGMSEADILRQYGSNPYCMDELSTLLTSLVVTSQITGQLTDFVLPRSKAYMRAWSEEFSMRRSGIANPKPLSFAEKQAKLEPFGGVNDRYGTLIIQIGYIVLFAPAFPLAALVTYVNNLVRLRADAFLLLDSTQRPRYQGAEDIGSWDSVLSVITFLGVMTNVGIVGITSSHLMRALPIRFLWFHLEKEDRLLLLVLAEHLLLVLVLLFKRGISDVPRDLSIAKAVDARLAKKKPFEGISAEGGSPDATARLLPAVQPLPKVLARSNTH